MIEPLGLSGVAELAVVERSGLVESRHLGAAVVVGPDGGILRAIGEPRELVYPRSTLKLAQATAVERTGVAMDELELVLSAASHGGTPEHLAIVAGMLGAAGLGEHDLGCPADWPLDAAARRGASGRSRLTMNCSGKHAGFLSACAHRGWPVANYLDPAHPLQRAVVDTIEDLGGEKVEHLGVDGCGAPLPALSLLALARAVSRVASGPGRLPSAILAHPWALDGRGRANTVAIERTGLIVKGGFEGMFVAATQEGVAVAVKVLDGAWRAASPVGLTLLAREGVVDIEPVERVIAEATPQVFGGELKVGSLRVLV